MASGSEDKGNWWETNLEWSLAGRSLSSSLANGLRDLRNIPSALSAHNLSQPSPMDHLEPDPVAKMKGSTPACAAVPTPPPLPPPLPMAQTPPPLPTAPLTPPPLPTAITPPPLPGVSAKASAPPPKPACLEKKLSGVDKLANSQKLSSSQKLKAVNIPARIPDKKKLTLEMLLDPDFCDY